MRRMKARIMIAFGMSVVMLAALAYTIWTHREPARDPLLAQDVSRVMSAHVREIAKLQQEESLQQAVIQANLSKLKISIAGKRQSQGGHTFYHDAVVLDMTDFNRILAIDPEKKTIRVQSGVTWDQIQQAINPYHLSIRTMQSSNIFTVGGSLGSNVHGRDPHNGPLIESVRSFRLLLADGTIVTCSREQHPDLFRLAIGGFGLFGVILDVELELTDDAWYHEISRPMDYRQYAAYVKEKVLANPRIGLHFARLSSAPRDFLREMYVTDYVEAEQGQPHKETGDLLPEQDVGRNRRLFGLSRHFDWGKTLIWQLQKRIYGTTQSPYLLSRNQAMRPPVEFLENNSPEHTDILQEYFVPMDRFADFVDGMRVILREDRTNLLNVTVRYVPQNDEAFLSYAKTDMLALVLYMNQKLTEQGTGQMKQTTQKLVDLCLEQGGTYYLTYQLYPTREQIRKAYPQLDAFFAKKRQYDPNERFMNQFYKAYSF